MASKKHLNILRQGVETWNHWRKENPDVKPHLIGAHLTGTDLEGADLTGAFLPVVHLEGAHLTGAHLTGAHLTGAHLTGADLEGADLTGAFLPSAHLEDADLTNAHLKDAFLPSADLSDADLTGADLTNATLTDTTLTDADLTNATLTNATLRGATLTGAYLTNVNLECVILSNATITGVCLYKTTRDDWVLDGIKCDYLFWENKPSFRNEKEKKELRWKLKDRFPGDRDFRPEEKEELKWELEHRFPGDRDFRAGEFEELYKQLPTLTYYFNQGFAPIDAVVMDQVVQTINERHPEFELQLDSLHSRGQPHAKFTVLHKEYTEELVQQITNDYETRIKTLAVQKKELVKIIKMLGSGNINIREADGNVTIQQLESTAV